MRHYFHSALKLHPRVVPVVVTTAVAGIVAVIVIGFIRKVRYLAELEPPTQYNHPYHGRVDERVMSAAETRVLCNSLDASPPAGVACAWVSDGTCHIVLPNDYQAPVSTYRRHEIAHCNGWPANHPK
jgi:hypothetical protein